MKNILLIFFCLIALNGFSQKEEAFVEEISSDWIKVVVNNIPVKPKTTTLKKKAKPNPSRKGNSQTEFDKTNSEISRFKKSKKN